jgi:hypothetical protein
VRALRVGLKLAVTAIVASLLGSCSTPSAAPAPQPSPAAEVLEQYKSFLAIPEDQRGPLLAQLRRRWFTNGRDGFFLDPVGSVGNALSLYNSLWWWKYSRSVGVDAGLNATEVQGWLSPLIGDPNSGLADSSGAPLVGILEAGTELELGLNISPDAPRLSSGIDSLRIGGLYASKTSGNAPPPTTGDWSSTGTAVRVLRLIREQPPEIVKQEIRNASSRAKSDRKIGDVATFIVPVLTASILIGDPLGPWLSEIEWIRSTVTSMPTTPAVEITASLNEVAPGLKTSATPAECREFYDQVLSEARSVDPHLLVNALSVGCSRPDVPIPVHGIAGWPNAQALSSALSSTMYGLLVTNGIQTGGLNAYREAVRDALRNGILPGRTGVVGRATARTVAALVDCQAGCLSRQEVETPGSVAEGLAVAQDALTARLFGEVSPHVDAQLLSRLASSGDQEVHRALRKSLGQLGLNGQLGNVPNGTDLRNTQPVSSPELIALGAWAEGRSLTPNERAKVLNRSGIAPYGLLEGTVLANWDYKDARAPIPLSI